MTLQISDIQPDIQRISRGLASNWPGVVAEDIEQEISLKLFERWESLSNRDAESCKRLALGLARREGRQYCSRERNEFQVNSAQWVYTPADIRTLLPALFDGTAWEDAPKRPSKGKEYLEADGISILMMDLRSAFEALAEPGQASVLMAYREGVKPERGSAESRRLYRAIDAMTTYLNREVGHTPDHEGPGSRDVISNAQARYRTSNDYEEA